MINKRMINVIFAFSVCALLLPQALHGYTQAVNDIELTVNDCAENSGEVLVYGSNNSITAAQFLQKGIHPVKLKISNKSSEPVIISPKSVFKEQVDVENAARIFHVDNQYTTSLLLDYYLVTIGVNTLFGILPGIASIFIPIIPPGSIVGAIHYFQARGKNKQLNQDFIRAFAERNKNGECVIQPGSSITKILLLKQDHRISRFTFRVFDGQNKQFVASFEVALDQ